MPDTKAVPGETYQVTKAVPGETYQVVLGLTLTRPGVCLEAYEDGSASFRVAFERGEIPPNRPDLAVIKATPGAADDVTPHTFYAS